MCRALTVSLHLLDDHTTASANGTVGTETVVASINTLPYVSVRANALLCTYLYIGVYDAAQMSNGLCSSYFRSHASVGVFSHTDRIFRVYNQCNDGPGNFLKSQPYFM